MTALMVMESWAQSLALKPAGRAAHHTILVVYGKNHRSKIPQNGREPACISGLSAVETRRLLDVLFLIRGLILLAARALLVTLTWFVRHRIGLAGFVTLLG